jgi:hypothetical protein
MQFLALNLDPGALQGHLKKIPCIWIRYQCSYSIVYCNYYTLLMKFIVLEFVSHTKGDLTSLYSNVPLRELMVAILSAAYMGHFISFLDKNYPTTTWKRG